MRNRHSPIKYTADLSSHFKIQKRTIRSVGLILILWFATTYTPFAGASDASLVLTPAKERYNLMTSLNILKVPDTQTGAAKILNAESESLSGLRSRVIKPSNHSSRFWFRFSLDDTDKSERIWCFDSGTNQMCRMNLFRAVHKNGELFLEEINTNLYRTNHFREERNAFFFRLPPNAATPTRLYLSIDTPLTLMLAPELMTRNAYFEKTRNRMLWYGLGYGFFLSMCIYNAFLFFSLRDRNYLLYLLFISGTLIYYLHIDGVTAGFILQKASPLFLGYLAHVTINLFLMAYIQFTRNFLATAYRFSVIDQCLKGFLAACTLLLVLIPMISYSMMEFLTLINTALLFSFILCAAIYCWWKGFRAARFFVLASTTFIIGAMGHILVFSGALPFTGLFFYGLKTGSIIEMTVLSLALADKVKILKNEKADSIRALKESEQLSRAKSIFLANMTHELRTPLNAILGLSRLLGNRDRSTETERQHLNIIINSGEHLLGLINQILEVSRNEYGNVSVQNRMVDIRHFITTISDMARLEAEKKGLRFRSNIRLDIPGTICTDDRLLRQILLNLLTNAVKFTENGKVVLEVGFYRNRDDMLLFEISDTGKGIHRKDIDNIFTPFWQADNNATDDNGIGLGLSISTGYAEALGGRLTLESKHGAGSRFRLMIPTAQRLKEESPEFRPCLKTTEPEVLIMDNESIDERLKKLPTDLMETFYQSLIDLDTERIRADIFTMKKFDAALAEHLGSLARSYRYDLLLSYLKPFPETP